MRGMRGAALAALTFGASLVSVGASAPAAASSPEYTGRATALAGTISSVTSAHADTGELPSAGGTLHAAAPTAGVGDSVIAETLHASTIGVGTYTHSEASAGSVTVNAGLYSLSADLVMSQANADNEGGWVIVTGRSHVDGLLLNGLPVVVTGEPNQTIPLLGGQLVINEQSTSTSGAMRSIEVTALHLTVGDVDVRLGRSKAGTTETAQACSPSADFATGGGWIVPDDGKKRTFGFVGGIRDGSVFRGHLLFRDHADGERIEGEITSYTPAPGNSRQMQGEGRLNGEPSQFVLEVTDNGEPGTLDEFRLFHERGVDEGVLGGGDIQVHPGC